MRGRVTVDLFGAYSDHNALCRAETTREFTDAELEVCAQALRDAGIPEPEPSDREVKFFLLLVAGLAICGAVTVVQVLMWIAGQIL